MFKERSHPLHETEPVLRKARLYPVFLEDGDDFPCFLVLPGGGYADVVHSEGPPVAAWLNSIGISAVTLEYSVSGENRVDGTYPMPQQQALYAMRWLRRHAPELNIRPDKIGVIGFSAGGHLAASVSHGFDREDWLLDPDHELHGISARPDASILAYSVLSTLGPDAHAGSMHNLLGARFDSALQSEMNWPNQIHPDAPPTFLWHTLEDKTVAVENSYLMALALQKKKILHEAHIFPTGAHGLGVCTIGARRQKDVGQWTSLAQRWLSGLGF